MKRKLVYLVAASLDGMIAEHDDSFACFPTEGEHIPDYLAALDAFDSVVMGRRTYDIAFKVGVLDPYPKLKTFVISKTLGASPHRNVTVISGDPVEFIRELKQQPGRDIYFCGGGVLGAQLLEAGELDELQVKLNPLLIGNGVPLFAQISKSRSLDLISAKTYMSGVVLLRYRLSDARI